MSLRTPAILLGLAYVGFLGFLAASADDLPARVATHFDIHGNPNVWMSRAGHLIFTFILGTIVPLLPIVLSRFLPAGAMNLPNRDYWSAPERRRETAAYLFRHSLWFAAIIVCFVSGVHYLILRANAQAVIQLSTPMLFVLLGSFLVALTLWAVTMLRRFWRVPQGA